MFKKIPHLEWIPMLFIAFILYKFVNNVEMFVGSIRFFFSIISYITWAFVIAYLLNPAMVLLEIRLKFPRWLSMLVVYIFFTGLIVLFSTIIVPIIARNVMELIDVIPPYVDSTSKWLNNLILNYEWFDHRDLEAFYSQNITYITGQIDRILILSLNEVVKFLIHITSSLIKFVIGSAVSIYLLKDKEALIKGIKKFIYSSMKIERAEIILSIGNRANYMFSRFLVGKILDSIIIGVMCYTGLLILNVRYALLISLIVGITNMIPYFGPLIGAVPGVLLTLLQDPLKALWVLIFLLLLQQFDGWILGPKILGNSVGLKPFWIIVGILIGGGLFGITGMVIGVPTVAVIKIFLNEYMERKLSAAKISID